ncbi:protease complex subunit PrcB family protein [Patescibacteria group bacterium]|nr:protease complex subunit PrcB family protein [Patescibacteria group bacterium]
MKRDVIIIVLMCVVAIGLGAWLYVMGVENRVPQAQEAAVSFSVIAEGTNASLTDRKNFKVESREQLEQVWAHAYGQTTVALPTVDFEKYQVLAVFGGQKNSGGHTVAVKEVVDTENTRRITITHSAPGSSCITTQALTSPFQFVRVEKSDARIERKDETVTVACD